MISWFPGCSSTDGVAIYRCEEIRTYQGMQAAYFFYRAMVKYLTEGLVTLAPQTDWTTDTLKLFPDFQVTSLNPRTSSTFFRFHGAEHTCPVNIRVIYWITEASRGPSASLCFNSHGQTVATLNALFIGSCTKTDRGSREVEGWAVASKNRGGSEIGCKRKHYKFRAEEDREHVLLWSGAAVAMLLGGEERTLEKRITACCVLQCFFGWNKWQRRSKI